MLHSMRWYSRSNLRNCLSVVAIISIVACNFCPTVGVQVNNQSTLSAAEEREAQQLSRTFTTRLGDTLDFKIAIHELFIGDAAAHYLAREKQRQSQLGASNVTLSSGLFVDAALLEKAAPDDWLRLYAEANNFLMLGIIHASLRNIDFGDVKPFDLYPPSVRELLDTNPLLRNLIQKKSELRTLKSADEMRSAAATLEQANKAMRAILPARVDIEATVMRLVMRSLAGGRRLTPEEMDNGRANLLKPRLDITNSDYFGFPKGTRMIWISSFAMMDLLLVRVDGKLRIVWTQPIDD